MEKFKKYKPRKTTIEKIKSVSANKYEDILLTIFSGPLVEDRMNKIFFEEFKIEMFKIFEKITNMKMKKLETSDLSDKKEVCNQLRKAFEGLQKRHDFLMFVFEKDNYKQETKLKLLMKNEIKKIENGIFLDKKERNEILDKATEFFLTFIEKELEIKTGEELLIKYADLLEAVLKHEINYEKIQLMNTKIFSFFTKNPNSQTAIIKRLTKVYQNSGSDLIENMVYDSYRNAFSHLLINNIIYYDQLEVIKYYYGSQKKKIGEFIEINKNNKEKVKRLEKEFEKLELIKQNVKAIKEI